MPEAADQNIVAGPPVRKSFPARPENTSSKAELVKELAVVAGPSETNEKLAVLLGYEARKHFGMADVAGQPKALHLVAMPGVAGSL